MPLLNVAVPLLNVAVHLLNLAVPLLDVAVPILNVAVPLLNVAVALLNVAVPLLNVAAATGDSRQLSAKPAPNRRQTGARPAPMSIFGAKPVADRRQTGLEDSELRPIMSYSDFCNRWSCTHEDVSQRDYTMLRWAIKEYMRSSSNTVDSHDVDKSRRQPTLQIINFIATQVITRCPKM